MRRASSCAWLGGSTLLLVLCLPALSSPAPAHADAPTNVLAGKVQVRASGVRRADAMVDGLVAEDGSHWKTRLSCVFLDASSSVVFDLGAPRTIDAARLSGDANDSYVVELSRDGRTFQPLWSALPTPRARSGMQTRVGRQLAGSGRYVRVRAQGGDGKLAISELELFSGAAALTLPELRSARAPELDARMRDRTLLFGLGLLFCLLLPARAPRWALAGAAAAGGWACWQLALGVWHAWPVDAQGVALVRGTIAFVGAAAIAREAFAPPRWPAARALTATVLGLCALLAPLAFYNLGQAQFYNPQLGRWSFVHYADLRQYYPTAKYFAELGYEHMYEADLAAYAAERPTGLSGLEARELRDLRSFQIVRVGEREGEIAATRARFSDERFAEYQRDARWFRGAMGDDGYLETMLDYGGNATPTWMAIAHVLFARMPPSDAAFAWLALLDPLLLLAAFIAIQRSFGWRTLWVSLLVFGANDFVMYGTNWAGAMLRHDWLAYLALGACALRRERWTLGGAVLALAAMIRAFPALALIGAALPALWRVGERIARTRSLPPWRELLESERAIVRVALGAAAMVALAALFSTAVLGAGAWGSWLEKVALLDADPHPASVALRNLIADPAGQERILRARWPLYAALLAFYLGAVLLAARNARPEQAAVLGLCLVPVVFYPSNYYLHLVFLLPLLAREQVPLRAREAVLWLIVLAMCALQYFTTLIPDLALHFYLSTVSLFAMLTALLCAILRHDPSVRGSLGLQREG